MGHKLAMHDLEKAIKKAQLFLLDRQRDDGTWAGELYYNGWTNATYILTLNVIGIKHDESIDRAAQWLLDHQNPDGTWGIFDFRGSPSSLEVTCQVVLALKMAGYSDRPEVKKAEEYSNDHGGVMNTQMITQAYHAVVGKFWWNYLFPVTPPSELFLIPTFFNFNLFATWGNVGVVPLLALSGLSATNSETLSATQKIGLGKAKAWLLDQQNNDGSWYDTILPTSLSIIALYRMGMPADHPRIRAAINYMKSLQNKEGYVHRYRYPVWNTVLVLLALIESGFPTNDSRLVKAGKWLIDAQTGSEGHAWPFHQNNFRYPDVDDTAFAVAVLRELDFEPGKKEEAIRKGINWLLEMQNDDGGWAAFTKNQSVKRKGIPAAFLEDPSVADVVGHVLLGLGYCGYDVSSPSIKRAIDWLKQDQYNDAWYGRWGVCYTYGTGATLVGLMYVGENMKKDYVRKAVKWIKSHQNSDGGWGEDYLSYYYPWFAGLGESTAEQTAWAIMGLIAAGEDPYSETLKNGINYLLEYQTDDGCWASSYVDAALWVYKDILYSTVFPLTALGMYRNQIQK